MAQPVSQADFAAALNSLVQFEDDPVVAVAVSGGGDSMALLHLVQDWAQARGGHAVALTVDHAIRKQSAAEAQQVAAWAAASGIEHIVLKWRQPQARATGLMERARKARYRLLSEACQQRGILYLLVAHHADDQAETVLLRQQRGSGPDGLAGMSAVVHTPHVTILRPLLGFTHAQLLATCMARGQGWIEDPSNASLEFTRPRLRAVLAANKPVSPALLATAAASARSRIEGERQTAALLAKVVRIMPQGYAEIDRVLWQDHDDDVRSRSLAQLLRSIGGNDYAPATFDRFVQHMPRRATLAGCLIESSDKTIRVIREGRNLQSPLNIADSSWTQWDRFQVFASIACTVAATGNEQRAGFSSRLARTIIRTQPGFYLKGQLIAAPTLGFFSQSGDFTHCQARFSPANPIGPAEFAIV